MIAMSDLVWIVLVFLPVWGGLVLLVVCACVAGARADREAHDALQSRRDERLGL